MNTKNIMIVGVGGQGSLLASKLLGRMLLQKGYDIKVSEVHGMSQRGGSVVTYVRFGDKVYSPVIDKGEADFIDNDRSVTKVGPGDVCVIHVGEYHSLENNSDEDVEFMALIYNEPGYHNL